MEDLYKFILCKHQSNSQFNSQFNSQYNNSIQSYQQLLKPNRPILTINSRIVLINKDSQHHSQIRLFNNLELVRHFLKISNSSLNLSINLLYLLTCSSSSSSNLRLSSLYLLILISNSNHKFKDKFNLSHRDT